MIRVEQLELTYKQNNSCTSALENLSLGLGKGQSCAVIGPSGCGKSSLLFLLAGLRFPDNGTVLIDGQRVNCTRAQTALILQDYGLFPWKTVWENAALGLEIRGISKREQAEIIEPILCQLGLQNFYQRYPSQLSGGQRQRLAFARALALEPDLLLMDEPFSALDALTREALQNTLLEIWLQRKFTMVLVTHNIEEAVYLGEKIFVLTSRPAALKKTIINPHVGSKEYRRTQEFYEHCNEIRGLLEESL